MISEFQETFEKQFAEIKMDQVDLENIVQNKTE